MTPKEVSRQLREYGVPQSTLAALINVSNPILSLWLRGKRDMGVAARSNIIYAMDFFKEIKNSSTLPIDFSNVNELRPFWEKFRRENVA